MLSVVVFLLVCLSGSVFSALLLRQEPGRVLPLSMTGEILLLYCFGLMGHLLWGVYAVLAVSLALYLVSVVHCIRENISLKQAISRVFSFPILLFLLLVLVFLWGDYRMLLHTWDEFSHWGDVVKAMTFSDALPADPRLHVAFASYPPAMPLFQYLFEKITFLCTGSAEFCEWGLYFAYKTFLISFIIPFLEDFRKSKLRCCLFTASIVLASSVFFRNLTESIYIDPTISIVSGCAMGMLFYSDSSEPYTAVYLSLTMGLLVLLKDVGLYFAVFICAAYLLYRLAARAPERHALWTVFCPILAALAAKLSWNRVLDSFQVVKMFSGKIDIPEYLSMFFLRSDSSYRQTVVDNSKRAFFVFEDNGHTVSFFVIVLLLIAGLIVCNMRLYHQGLFRKKSLPRCFVVLESLQLLLYFFFIGAMYVYRFSEYEALNLASYSRYIFIVLLHSAIVLIVGLYHIEFKKKKYKQQYSIPVLICICCLLASPSRAIGAYFVRRAANNAIVFRAPYMPLSDKILEICPEESKIYFISRGNNGIDYWVSRFNARPCELSTPFGGWSPGSPLYNGDIWFWDLSPDEWMDYLLENGYTYIAVYNPGIDFRSNYGSCFETSEDIAANALFALDKDRRLLITAG